MRGSICEWETKVSAQRLLPEKIIVVYYRWCHVSSLRGPHQTRYLQNLAGKHHRYLSFDYQANDFNSAGPEKLASDDQLYSAATGFVNQYCLILPCFLWEEFFAALNRVSVYEETKAAELKISKDTTIIQRTPRMSLTSKII